MIEGVRDLRSKPVWPKVFGAGIRALYTTAVADGVFCYAFLKVVGEKERGA